MSVRWVRLGELVTRKSEPVQVDGDTEYRMIGLLNRGRGLLDRGTIRGSETKYPRLQKLREGDLVYSKLFGWEGAVTLADRGGWVSPEFPVYEVNEPGILPGYLAHVLRTEAFVQQLADGTTGLGQRRQRVPPATFEAAEIVLPSVADQEQIAARLDALAATTAPLAAAKSSRTRAARERLILDALTGAPAVPFGRLLSLQRRGVKLEPSTSYREIGVRSFGRGLFVKPATNADDIGTKRVFWLAPGDLVISNIFAWEGAVAVAQDVHAGMIGSHRFMTWTPRSDDVDVHFVAAYLTSRAGIEKLRAASPGSAGRNRTLAIGALENLEIPLPSIDAQRTAVGLLARLERVEALTEHRRAVAAALLPAARNEEFSRLVAQADGRA